MKDSGVEWIGEIPEHWEIIPLKYITNFISRGNSPEYVEESSIKVINQACIYWDELKIENVKYQYDDIDFDKLKGKLIKGDLLLNSTGTGTLGRAVVFREDGNYMADSHVTIIRFNKMKMDEFFAFYILQTQIYQGYIYNALVTGATNQIELSRERLTATPMIVPPSTEQQEIVNFLDAKIGQIAILINEIKIQIEKLKEYRQSLISEAVTGKIDVRDYKDEEMSNLNLIKKVERRVSRMKNETIYLDRDMNQRFEKEFEAAKKDWEKDKQEYEKQKRDNDKKQF
jgi:type I restriction enzyme S subunit